MILGYKDRTNLAPWLTGRSAGEFGDLEAEHTQLCEWLRDATGGLAAPAKQRIRMEIGAHYTEAMAAHVADGMSESDAKVAAVAELGDARAAAKRFRKRHLTAEEAEQAASYLKWARSVWGLLGMYLLFCFVQFMDRHFPHREQHLAPSTLFIVGFLALVVVPTVCVCVARRRNSKLNTCLIVLLLSGAIYVWMLSEMFSSEGPGYWLLVNCLTYACMLLIRPLRLWYKLRRAGDDGPEMPPSNTASS
jgi:hypothetical protein